MNPLSASATAIAAAIRSGQTSSRAVVSAHIQKMQAVNPRINAVVQTRYEQALQEADAADALIASGAKDLPPLLGVPCTIKENFQLAGFKQVSGMVARRNMVSSEDAPTVARLRRAGAVVLGTTNTPELCMWMETSNHVYGITRNPYDASRIVGGSSGGEGAVIGAGASPFGLGADVGGSIRFPAFFNGVFGHKPTPGIVPNTGQFPLPIGAMNELCVTGPICRRAEDLWPLLNILAGADGIDPIAGRLPLGAGPAQQKLQGLRVMSLTSNGRTPIASDLASAQTKAAQWLASVAGTRLLAPSIPLLRQSFPIWSASMQAAKPPPFAVSLGQGARISVPLELLRWGLRRSPHTFPALMLAGLEQIPLPQDKALAQAAALKQQLLDLLGNDGVLLFPPYPSVAPRHHRPLLKPFAFAYCGLINAMGLPSTAVPLGLNREGLPMGTQVIAAPGKDALCIAVAGALEQAFGGWQPPAV